MRYEDLCQVTNPTLSVVTPSLNHGRFLRETIETILSQTFRDFEHIVVDGGSTDETISILKEYRHIHWTSEKDASIVVAYRKGFATAKGRYIIQCAVSDGFLDRNWFQKCVDVLDRDEDVSLVWGTAQNKSEDGDLLNVCHPEFFNDPPPQKRETLAFWLATGFPFPEGNYCVRSDVIKALFPDGRSEEYFQVMSHLGFIYRFMTAGYLPYFIPAVANFGRQHADQRSRRLRRIESVAAGNYFERLQDYRRDVLAGRGAPRFRNGRGEVIGELGSSDLARLRRQIWRHRILRSRLLRRDPYTLAVKIGGRLKAWARGAAEPSP